MRFYKIDSRNERTFVKTAMDAYELPKLMPTMEGTAETSIGASAVPFGMSPLGAMVYGGSKGTRTISKVPAHGKKSVTCERQLMIRVLSLAELGRSEGTTIFLRL
jgi:hypothetical protein